MRDILMVTPGTKTYVLGVPFDYQGDEIYVDEWGKDNSVVQDDVPNWIKFKNSTVSNGIKFEISPNIQDLDKSYFLFIVLADHN